MHAPANDVRPHRSPGARHVDDIPHGRRAGCPYTRSPSLDPRHPAAVARAGRLHGCRRPDRMDLLGLRPDHLRQPAPRDPGRLRLVQRHGLLRRHVDRPRLARRRARGRSAHRPGRTPLRADGDDRRSRRQLRPRGPGRRPGLARAGPRSVGLRHVRAGRQRGLPQRGVRHAREGAAVRHRPGGLASRRHAVVGARRVAVAGARLARRLPRRGISARRGCSCCVSGSRSRPSSSG